MSKYLEQAKEIYEKVKCNSNYIESSHCPLILKVMLDPEKGTLEHFCSEVMITERTFYNWVRAHPVFSDCYYLGKMFGRVNWENEGREMRFMTVPIGTINNAFEYWKMIGWSRYGISNKNSRIKLNLNPSDNPSQHYAQLLAQAAEGDFTAGEIKQLMEAVNVGMNAHQVFTLQKEMDELKSDLAKMDANRSVQNTFTNKGNAQKD